MPQNPQVIDPEFLDSTLDYVQKTSFTLKRAMDEVNVHRTAQQKAAALRPEVLALGVKIGCFPAHQSKEAEAMLASHDTTLVLLKQAMEMIAEKSAKTKTELGDAADAQTSKQAADAAPGYHPQPGEYNSLTDPNVGNKSPRGKKASDLAFEKILHAP